MNSSSSDEIALEDGVDKTSPISCTEDKKGKKKKRKRKLNLPAEIKANPKLRKYWQRRYTLFSKFDDGIKLDEGKFFCMYIFSAQLKTAKLQQVF